MSTQRAHGVLLFLVLVVNSALYVITRSYSSHPFLCALDCNHVLLNTYAYISTGWKWAPISKMCPTCSDVHFVCASFIVQCSNNGMQTSAKQQKDVYVLLNGMCNNKV